MNHRQRILNLMAKKRKEKSPQRRKENSTGILLQEQGSGTKSGKNGENMPNLLIESYQTTLSIEESKGGNVVLMGKYGRVGVPTSNGRIYSRELMEREIARLKPLMREKRVVGQLDHPSDGKPSLSSYSHVILDLNIDEDGWIIGKSKVLKTLAGQNLKALAEEGIPVGLSSRGRGSTVPVSGKIKGEMVQDDFTLQTFDVVADPAVKDALPIIRTEDMDEKSVSNMFMEEFPFIMEDIQSRLKEEAEAALLQEGKGKGKGKEKEKSVDEVIKETEERVRLEMSEAFEKNLAESLMSVTADVEKGLREEFSSDPDIGAAKATLAQIAEITSDYYATPDEKTVKAAIKARDLEVSEAVKERDEALEKAVQASYALYVEREIGKHPMAESIRKLLKGQRFESLDQTKEKLDTILKDLPESTEGGISEDEAKLREENAEFKGKTTLLEERAELLDKKLKRAVEIAEGIDNERIDAQSHAEKIIGDLERQLAKEKELLGEARLDVYKHEKVAGLPKGRKVLALLESVNSKAAVDSIIAENAGGGVSRGDLIELQEANKRGHSAHGSKDLSEKGGQNKIAGVDIPISDLQKMAGLE